MGYRDVYWYQDGLKGWRQNYNYIESSDFAFRTRALPRSVDPEDLYRNIQAKDGKFILVDIRDEKSREKFGVIDAPTRHCPLYRLSSDYSSLPTRQTIILMDIAGKQVPAACRFLLSKRFAFTKLYWLKGGITAWKQAGLPVEEFHSADRL